MGYRHLLSNYTLCFRVNILRLTSNLEVLREIPTTKQPTLSEIDLVHNKKTKRNGQSRGHVDRLKEYLNSKPSLQALQNVIPASYFLKPSGKNKSRRTFLVDKDAACDIMKVLRPHLETGSGHIMELNAGAGVLTEELLKAKLQNLRIYEPDVLLCNHLLELIKHYKSDARLFNADLFNLGNLRKLDKRDGGHRIETLFEGLPSFNWEDEPVVKMIGTMQNDRFIRSVMFNIILQDFLCQYGRPELFLILSQEEYEKLKSKPSEEKIYRSSSVLFQVLFDHEVLLRVPEKALIPWHTPQKTKRLKKQCKEVDDDLCFLKLTPKKDLLQTISPDLLKPFWFFVKFLMHKKSSILIDRIERWIPGSGVRLISKGYTIFTDCGSLAPDEYFKIYLDFSSWPEFHSCSFFPYVEGVLGKILQYSLVEEEVSDKKLNELLSKGSDVSEDDLDIFVESANLEDENKNDIVEEGER